MYFRKIVDSNALCLRFGFFLSSSTELLGFFIFNWNFDSLYEACTSVNLHKTKEVCVSVYGQYPWLTQDFHDISIVRAVKFAIPWIYWTRSWQGGSISVCFGKSALLQGRVMDLEGKIHRAAAERGAVEQKKNEFQGELEKQRQQIDKIQSLHSFQMENANRVHQEEKVGLFLATLFCETVLYQDTFCNRKWCSRVAAYSQCGKTFYDCMILGKWTLNGRFSICYITLKY